MVCGQAFSLSAFYSNTSSLNPAQVYYYLKRTKNKQKRCRECSSQKIIYDLAVSSATVSEVLTMHKSFHLRRAALGEDFRAVADADDAIG